MLNSPTIFISTTWFGNGQTDLERVLDEMRGLDIQGIELGSTHVWRPDFKIILAADAGRKLFTHNYFPPAEQELVLNIASKDPAVRDASLAHASCAIQFASEIGASLYTIHPGFLSDADIPSPNTSSNAPYDFVFNGEWADRERAQKQLHRSLSVLLEVADKSGVRLAVETQGSFIDAGVSLLERPSDYDEISDLFEAGLEINFNFAHSWFAAQVHEFEFDRLLAICRPYLAAIELSHNDGTHDHHAAIPEGSYVLDWVGRFGDIPLILEFRNASRPELETAIDVVRRAAAR